MTERSSSNTIAVLRYGRDARGPLDILKELWEASQKSDESVDSYVLSTQDKLWKMTELLQKYLIQSRGKQKAGYDKKAQVREFQVGDPVLILLPTSTSKLLAQWQGSYQVVKCMSK